MYYIAGATEGGNEMGCDFGFDMIERIILDEIFMELPARVSSELIVAKRFSYFGDRPGVPVEQLVGKKAWSLQTRFNLMISRDFCLATVVKREGLLAALRRSLIKVVNIPLWRCGHSNNHPDLFNNLAVYNPYLLRSMLAREKYGEWNHGEDGTRALRVLYKFINFLYERDDLRYIIMYNELICPHWEASGEMYFNNKGELTYFNYFGRGNGQSYRYYPDLGVWQRK